MTPEPGTRRWDNYLAPTQLSSTDALLTAHSSPSREPGRVAPRTRAPAMRGLAPTRGSVSTKAQPRSGTFQQHLCREGAGEGGKGNLCIFISLSGPRQPGRGGLLSQHNVLGGRQPGKRWSQTHRFPLQIQEATLEENHSGNRSLNSPAAWLQPPAALRSPGWGLGVRLPT